MKQKNKQRFGSQNGKFKHGLRKSRLYRIWANMKNRCYNPNVETYKNYGSRGIEICSEWLNDFYSFYTWAINHGYNDSLTIDRIDFYSGYSPENCRWVTIREQSLNKRTNHYVTLNNKTHPLDEWSRIFGINSKTVRSRLDRGWSYEKALTTPVKEVVLQS